MRIAAWNVAHQIRQRPFPTEVLRAFLTLEPDVVVFTEYPPGPDHGRAVADLADAGFSGIHISDRVERQNQVLVATRMVSECGSWAAPPIRPQVPPNFLHVVIPRLDLRVVGLRIPMFVRGDTAGEHLYRDWIRDQAPEWGTRPTVVIGDLNVGPHRARSWQWRSLTSFAEEDWIVVTPGEGWSYMGRKGHTTRIDHALLSPGLVAKDTRYTVEAGGMVMAGNQPPAYSDHAVLVVDAELMPAAPSRSTGALEDAVE